MVAPRATHARTPATCGHARSVTTTTTGCLPGKSVAIQAESSFTRSSPCVASNTNTVSRCSVTASVYPRLRRRKVDELTRTVSGRVGRRNTGRGKAVSYTHLRAHETPEHLVCRL